MSFVKILDISVNIQKTAANKDFMDELSHEIEKKLANLDDTEGLPYGKADIVQLISSIEKDKFDSCGQISAQGNCTLKLLQSSANSRYSIPNLII